MPAGGPDALLHHVDERGHVVLGDAFACFDRFHVETRSLTDRGRVGPWDHPELGPRLDREDLDLEPSSVAGVVGEQRRHRFERVSGDHRDGSCSGSGVSESAAMSVRYCIPGQETSAAAA